MATEMFLSPLSAGGCVPTAELVPPATHLSIFLGQVSLKGTENQDLTGVGAKEKC